MAANRAKKENIITIAVVVFAVILSAVVILVKTGVIGKPSNEPSEAQEGIDYEVVTTKVLKSVVNDQGDVEYVWIDEVYTRPLHSSNHRYPTTTTTTKPTTEDDMTYFIEQSEVVKVTDENGEQVTDENGEPVTKINVVTIITDKDGKTTTSKDTTTETTTETTSERTTKIIYVTDPILKKPIKNIKGEYIVSGVETEPETTAPTTAKPSSTTKPSTTKKPASSAENDTASSTTAPKSE